LQRIVQIWLLAAPKLYPQIGRLNASLFANSYVLIDVMATRVLLALGLALSMAWVGLVGYALVKLIQNWL
jgi:hypothetical protein